MPLSNEAIDRLRRDILRHRNSQSTSEQSARFSKHVKHANEIYELARMNANMMRKRIFEINRIASLEIDQPLNYKMKPKSRAAVRYKDRTTKQCETLTEIIERLDKKTLSFLRERFEERFTHGKGIVDPSTLLIVEDISNNRQENDDEQARQTEYLKLIASLTQIGAFFKTSTGDDGKPRIKQGRLRPGGKQSRPPPQVILYAPGAEQNPMRRGPERELEAYLAVAWLELTGDPEPRQSGAYLTFIEYFLAEVGAREINVRRLVEEADFPVQARRRDDAIKAIGCLPPDRIEWIEHELKVGRRDRRKNDKIANLSGGVWRDMLQ